MNLVDFTPSGGGDGSGSIGFLGQEYQFEENISEASTTSGTFATYLSLTTPVIPAGTYRLLWTHKYSCSTVDTVGEVRTWIDAGAQTLDVQSLQTGHASLHIEEDHTDIKEFVLAAGAHTIDIDYRRSGGIGTFEIDDAKMEFFRVL